MEIREYAQGLLLGRSIEEKLATGGDLGDQNPEPLSHFPEDFPVRPPGLEMGRQPSLPVPSGDSLAEPEKRAVLLHAFANHELLAIELMALALLKFPQAPSHFRRGLVKTIHDEQKHLRMYRQRLNEMGYELGQFPVNSFFWNVLKDMQSPTQFLATMSLTFEQANLDYCLYYGSEFRRHGDQKSASLMDIVLRDEMNHVGFGLGYFNKWTDPSIPLFERHKASLVPQLNLKRAKGKSFSTIHRLKIGFDENYINSLQNYEQSTGRASNVYLYNPDCEESLAHAPGPSTPRQLMSAMISDLSTLPVVFAKQDDVVLTSCTPPPPEFVDQLRKAGFSIPQFIAISPHASQPLKELSQRKIYQLRPWGWSTKVQGYFRKNGLKGVTPGGGEQLSAAQLKSLFSKVTSASWLKDFISQPQMLGAPFVDHLDCGTPVSSLHDIHRIYDGFHASAHRLAVIKAPLSLSGHNFVFIRNKVDILNQTTRLTKLLKTHSTLVMEPWLDKVFDYSLQIEITPQGQILEKGIARFITDTKGRYLGAMVGGLFNDLNSDLVRFLSGISWAPSDSQRITVLTKVNQELARYVGRELLKCGYSGPVGIDQFVFKNEKGEFRIKPLVEINPRYNMGRVAVELGRRVPPGRAALWNVYSQKDLLKMNIRSFQHFAQAIEKHFPPMELNSRNQILSGPLWLSPPTSAQEFCALLIVGESYGQLKEKMEAIS